MTAEQAIADSEQDFQAAIGVLLRAYAQLVKTPGIKEMEKSTAALKDLLRLWEEK